MALGKATWLKDLPDTQAIIDDICPESREKSLAMTNVEQAVMWANAAIARHG